MRLPWPESNLKTTKLACVRFAVSDSGRDCPSSWQSENQPVLLVLLLLLLLAVFLFL